MIDVKRTWACIVDLAATIDDPASGAGADEQLALARLVLDFHRDVVRHPLRERAVERTPDRAAGNAPASPPD